MNIVTRYFNYLKTWRQHREAIKHLNRMSDHELRDIGINRYEIDRLVWLGRDKSERGRGNTSGVARGNPTGVTTGVTGDITTKKKRCGKCKVCKCNDQPIKKKSITVSTAGAVSTTGSTNKKKHR